VEGNLATHYRRYYPTFYIKAEGEVDLAYIDRNRFHPVEVKWTGISALRLGLVNAAYYDGYLKVLKGWSIGLSTTEITYEYNTSWRR